MSLKEKKEERLKVLKSILEERYDISRQSELLEIMNSLGHEISQSELSRSLKKLKYMKNPSGYYSSSGMTILEIEKESTVNVLKRASTKHTRFVKCVRTLAIRDLEPGFNSVIANKLKLVFAKLIVSTFCPDDTTLMVYHTGRIVSDQIDDDSTILSGKSVVEKEIYEMFKKIKRK